MSSPQSHPARSSSQLYTPYPHGSNQTGAPLNRALPFSSPSPAQTQSQPHQKARIQHIYARPVSHQVLPSVPQHSHTQLPQPFQRTQNRDSNAFSSNLQPYQTQSSQSAGATSTQAFQQDLISNTTRPISNFGNCIQDVYIAVMGITGSGKSTFVGICSEKNAPVGHDLESKTKTVQVYSFMLQNSIRVNLLDTPGFDDTVRDDFTVLGEVAEYLDRTYRMGILLRGIIYLHKIDDNRVRGSSRANLDMLRELCGTDFQKRVIILTTMWDKVTSEKGRQCEIQLQNKHLGSMIKNGSQIRRFSQYWGRVEALKIISQLVQEYSRDAPVQIQTELFGGLVLKETGAGQVLHKDLLKQEEEWIQRLRDLNKDYKAAMARNDASTKRQLGILKIQRQQALDKQTQVQERLERIEANNHHLRHRFEELADYQDLKDDEIESLNHQVKQFRREWERREIRSAEELRKSRMLQAEIYRLKNSRSTKVFGFVGDIFKIGVTAACSKYFR